MCTSVLVGSHFADDEYFDGYANLVRFQFQHASSGDIAVLNDTGGRAW